MAVRDQERQVVGDELGEEGQDEEDEKDPQRDEAPLVRLEAPPPLPAERAEAPLRPHDCLVSKSMRGSTRV